MQYEWRIDAVTLVGLKGRALDVVTVNGNEVYCQPRSNGVHFIGVQLPAGHDAVLCVDSNRNFATLTVDGQIVAPSRRKAAEPRSRLGAIVLRHPRVLGTAWLGLGLAGVWMHLQSTLESAVQHVAVIFVSTNFLFFNVFLSLIGVAQIVLGSRASDAVLNDQHGKAPGCLFGAITVVFAALVSAWLEARLKALGYVHATHR